VLCTFLGFTAQVRLLTAVLCGSPAMFECHENGIIEELKSVWIMVSVLSLCLPASLSLVY